MIRSLRDELREQPHAKISQLTVSFDRDGSACMSYTLEREQSSGGLVERWIPYRALPFERNDMASRQEQLTIRTRECTQTLDLLARLNDGVHVQHLLQCTMDLAMFKVFYTTNKCRGEIHIRLEK